MSRRRMNACAHPKPVFTCMLDEVIKLVARTTDIFVKIRNLILLKINKYQV